MNKLKSSLKLALIFTIISLNLVIFGLSVSGEVNSTTILNEISAIRLNISTSGFPTARIDDLFSEAQTAAANKQTDKLAGIENDAKNLQELIFATSRQLDETELQLSQAKKLGYNVNSLLSLLENARLEFKKENYEGSEKSLDEINKNFRELTRNSFSNLGNSISNLISTLESNNISSSKIKQFYSSFMDAEQKNDLTTLEILQSEFSALNQSTDTLISMKNLLEGAKQENLPIEELGDLYFEALLAFESGQYGALQIDSDKFEALLKEIRRITDKLKSLEETIKEAENNKIETAEAKNFASQANDEFSKGNFNEASRLASLTENYVEEQRNKAMLFGVVNKNSLIENISCLLKKFGLISLGFLLALIIISIISYPYIKRRIISLNIKKLEKQQENLINHIKEIQQKYYIEKSLSKDMYENYLEHFQKSLIKIKKEIPLLRNQITE